MIKTLQCICPGENRRQGCFTTGIATFFPAVSSTWMHKKEKSNCWDKPKLFKRTVGKTERHQDHWQSKWGEHGQKEKSWFWGHRGKRIKQKMKKTKHVSQFHVGYYTSPLRGQSCPQSEDSQQLQGRQSHAAPALKSLWEGLRSTSILLSCPTSTCRP